MNARCIKCSSHIDFRNTRGAKLRDRRCSCGGQYELLGHIHLEDHYIDKSELPEGMNTLDFTEIPNGFIKVYPSRNSKGVKYILHRQNRKWILLNPESIKSLV